MAPTYTVAVCNYNMVRTVERSLRSILAQTTDDFEVLVVDGGSTDGSLRVLRVLSSEFDRLRVICTVDHEPSGLAADRNVAAREAGGEYVLMQLDTDDEYTAGIVDFVEVFHHLEAALPQDFYLKGRNINIGSRSFLLDYGPYRPGIDRAEDRDLWRRLLADDAILWLNHGSISRSIGYEPTFTDQISNYYQELTGEFRAGVSLASAIGHRLRTGPIVGRLGGFPVLLLAYVASLSGPRYELPDSYQQKRALEMNVTQYSGTVRDFEDRISGFKLDELRLSEAGKDIFLTNIRGIE